VSGDGALGRGAIRAGGKVPQDGNGSAGRSRGRGSVTFRAIREGEYVLAMMAIGAFATSRVMRHMAIKRGGYCAWIGLLRRPDAKLPIVMSGHRRGGDGGKGNPEQAAGKQI